jgi:hypothetical protein
MSVDSSIVVAWLVLLTAAGFVVAVAAWIARRQQRATKREADDVESLDAHAAAVAAEAVAAEEHAATARERLAGAESARDAAWQAADEAQAAHQAARRAVAQVSRAQPPGAATGAGESGADAGRDRERIVSRAALQAYRRGDLTLEQLREVYRRAAGWHPEQERRVREAERCGVAERAARRAYEQAAAAARRAEQAVSVAELAADALVEEAARAAGEAELARVSRPRRRWPRRTG